MSPYTQELWLLICMAIIAAAALLLIIMMIGIAISAGKARKRMESLAREIEDDVMPTVRLMHSLLEETSPKIKLATDQVLEVSRTVRLQVDHINETVNEIVDKTHTQVNRVDECMTMVMGGIGRAGETVQRATGETSRKMNAVMTGIRVGVDALRYRRKSRETPGV